METKRILIVQTAFIGDVILITPLIKAVRSLYPKAVIDAMVVPVCAQLLQNNPHLNSVISYPKRKNALQTMLQMIKLLRQNKYDLAISPHSSGRTHLLLSLSHIPVRIGFDRSLFPWLLTAKIPHPGGMHKIEKNLKLLSLLSPQQFEMQTELFPSEQDFARAKQLLGQLRSHSIIAIAPGSIWETKCWHLDYYKQLASQLVNNGLAIVLIGGEGDKDKCQQIEQFILTHTPQAAVLNLAGKTALLQSAAVISQSKLMICNDSGALHIANAMQTRVFAFFGPTVQSIGYYPYRAGDYVFETDLNCRPCGSHGHHKCPLKHHNCMKQISRDAVLQAVLTAIQPEALEQ